MRHKVAAAKMGGAANEGGADTMRRSEAIPLLGATAATIYMRARPPGC